MSDKIDYGTLMHDAMRSLIRKVLTDVSENGLPGAHHFFITFDTRHEAAELADWLRERYPAEMTIVIQHWFEGLDVREDGFFVTLNFGDAPEPLYVPYDAIETFVDPSVEFGLRFETSEGEGAEETHLAELSDETRADEAETEAEEAPMEEEAEPAPRQAEVVSLDKFRK